MQSQNDTTPTGASTDASSLAASGGSAHTPTDQARRAPTAEHPGTQTPHAAAATAVDAAPMSPLPEGLLEACSHLQRGLQGAMILGPDHPAVIAAAHAAVAAIAPVAARLGRVMIGAGRDTLHFQDEPLPDTPGHRALAAMLYELRLAGLVFRPGFDNAASENLLTCIAQARATKLLGQELVARCKGEVGEGLEVVPVNYEALRVSNVQDKGEQLGASRLVSWGDFTKAMFRAAGVQGGDDISGVAKYLESLVKDSGKLQEARGIVAEFAGAISGMPEHEGAQATRHLSALTLALSPEMRRALTSFDAGTPRQSSIIAAQTADALPVEEVLASLCAVDKLSEVPSAEAMMLCMKLSRIVERSPEHRTVVAQIEEKWRTRLEQSEGLKGSLEEMLHTRNKAKFSPDDYAARLAEISHHVDAIKLRYADDVQSHAAAMRVHAAGIAAEVVLNPCSAGEPVAGACEAVRAELPRVIDGLDHAQLLRLLHAMRNLSMKHDHQPTRESAGRCVAGFQGTKILGKVAAAVCDQREEDPQVIAMLRAGDWRSLRVVASQAALSHQEFARTLFASLVLCAEASTTQSLIDELCDQDPSVLVEVMATIIEQTRERFDVQLDLLVTHRDPRVRKLAMDIQAALRQGLTPAQVRSALADEDRSVWGGVLEIVAKSGDSDLIHEVARVMDGDGETEPLAEVVFDHAALALIAAGERGEVALSTTLRHLTNRLKALEIRRAERLALIVDGRCEHEALRGAVVRWKVSFSRLLSVFVQQQADAGTATALSARAQSAAPSQERKAA